MSGHSELEVVNQPFEYYGPQQHDNLSQKDEHGRPYYQENTKFIGMPVFPAELPFENSIPNPIVSSHRTSSNLSDRQFTNISEAPSSPTLHSAPLIKQPVSTEKETVESIQGTQKERRPWKWYMLGGVVALVVIIAAVVGGIVASKKNKTSNVNGVSGGAPSSNSNSLSPTSSASNNSPTSTYTASSVSSTIAPFQRNVAAISYASNNVNNSRVYYQDNQGHILESHSNASSEIWSTSQIVTAKNGSSFAAAVTMPANNFVGCPSPNPERFFSKLRSC